MNAQGKFGGVAGNLTVLAEIVVPLAPGVAETPTQVHLAFADDVADMWVQWTSSLTDADATPVVQFGPSEDALNRTAHGESDTYFAADMCHAPANTSSQQTWIHPGMLHRVLLQGLAPDTRYYYRVGCADHNNSDRAGGGGGDGDGSNGCVWSPVRSFKSRVALGDRREVKFLAYGDQDWDDPCVCAFVGGVVVVVVVAVALCVCSMHTRSGCPPLRIQSRCVVGCLECRLVTGPFCGRGWTNIQLV